MSSLQPVAKDDPERIVLSNIAESILRLAGLFTRPCVRPAPAAQRRDSGPPSGLRPLVHPWTKEVHD
jgi:hypothetical protein